MPPSETFVGPLSSPDCGDWGDDFGPGGQCGLGRNWCGESVRPPVTFTDLAARLTVQRRAMFFWTTVHDAFDIFPIAEQFLKMQASIDKTLSRYDGRDGDRLIDHLVQCSDRKFLRCLRAVMIDTGLPEDMYCEEPEDDESSDTAVYRDDYGSPYLCMDPNVAPGCLQDGSVRTSESRSQLDLDWELPEEEVAASKALIQKAKEMLPLETYRMLEKAYLAKFFAHKRRHLIPQNLEAPEQRLTNSVFNSAYEETRQTHVQGNTWVIDGEDFLGNLYSVPGWSDDERTLRRVELVCSLRDVCQACLNKVHDELTPVGYEPVLWGQEQLEWDVLKVLDRHVYDCGIVYRDIVKQWVTRFNMLATMPLEYMLLDFTQAHDLSGHFIGLEVAESFGDFKHDTPKELIVKAPTEELAIQIRAIIVKPEEPPAPNPGGW